MRYLCVFILAVLFSCNNNADGECRTPKNLAQIILDQSKDEWKVGGVLYIYDSPELDSTVRKVIEDASNDALQIQKQEYLFMRAVNKYLILPRVDCEKKLVNASLRIDAKYLSVEFDITK